MAPRQARDRVSADNRRRGAALAAVVAGIAVGTIVAAQSAGSIGATPSVDASPSNNPGGAQRWTSTDTEEVLETSIVVAVMTDDEDLPIWTDPQPARVCPLNRLSARVAMHPDDGFGFIDTAGNVHGVEWPPGFSARQLPGGPLLFGPEGEVIAQEGDVLVFSGSGAVAADGLVHPCFFDD